MGWDERRRRRRREEMRGEGGRNSIYFFIQIAYMFSLDLDAPAQRDGRSIHANYRKACCQSNGNRGTQVVRERATTQITFQHQKKRERRNSISFFIHIAYMFSLDLDAPAQRERTDKTDKSNR